MKGTKKVYLFHEEDKIRKKIKRESILLVLKDSIVGGPSIIFNRYHEANKQNKSIL
jgi:hypothetical protein